MQPWRRVEMCHPATKPRTQSFGIPIVLFEAGRLQSSYAINCQVNGHFAVLLWCIVCVRVCLCGEGATVMQLEWGFDDVNRQTSERPLAVCTHLRSTCHLLKTGHHLLSHPPIATLNRVCSFPLYSCVFSPHFWWLWFETLSHPVTAARTIQAENVMTKPKLTQFFHITVQICIRIVTFSFFSLQSECAPIKLARTVLYD